MTRWNKTYNVFDKDTVKIPLNETLAPVATVTPTPIPTQKPKKTYKKIGKNYF